MNLLMDMFFGLMCLASVALTPIMLIVIVVRSIKKKSLKKFVIVMACSILAFIVSMAYIFYDIEKDGVITAETVAQENEAKEKEKAEKEEAERIAKEEEKAVKEAEKAEKEEAERLEKEKIEEEKRLEEESLEAEKLAEEKRLAEEEVAKLAEEQALIAEEERIAAEEELKEKESVVEDVVENESEFYTTKVIEENGETEYIKVPVTRTVNGVRIRTVTTETEGFGIVKIIATDDIVEGLDCLEDYGFSSDEIKKNEEILDSVGVEEIYVSQYVPNGSMGICTAYIYDSEGMQLNVTFENNTIISAQLTGIVDKAEYSTRDDELDVGVGLQGHSSVDLYYDIDGGALAYLDWENKTLDKL